MWHIIALLAVAMMIIRSNRPTLSLTDRRFAEQLSYWRRSCRVIELMFLAGNRPRIKERR